MREELADAEALEHLAQHDAGRAHRVREQGQRHPLRLQPGQGRARAWVHGGRNQQRRGRVGVDQRGHRVGRDAGRQAGIDRGEDGAHVLHDGHVLVLRPQAAQEAPGVLVGALQRDGGDLHGHPAQDRLEVGHAPALVAIVAAGRIEQQRAPEVDRDRADPQRSSSKRGGRFSRKAAVPSRGSPVRVGGGEGRDAGPDRRRQIALAPAHDELLLQPHRRRRARGDRVDHRIHGRLQPGALHDAVDQAPRQRLLGPDGGAGQQQLGRARRGRSAGAAARPGSPRARRRGPRGGRRSPRRRRRGGRRRWPARSRRRARGR